ncbi:MAG: NAD(P)-dependent alcohol dehydrogenase [Sphingomonadales bacterium]|nr:MAG: NAD(P)-dependent alcohol dehydrogenase [Sphingomonadales bacterium]
MLTINEAEQNRGESVRRFEIGTNPSIASLVSVEREPAAPVGDELLVRVEASSLNFHDYLVATGAIKVAPGRVPLSDGVGIVEACGPDAVGFTSGDRVIGTFFAGWSDGPPTAARVGNMLGDHVDGFASHYVTMSERLFTRSPKGLAPVEAAALPCAGLTAWRATVVEGAIKPGSTVLVQGTGGVSVFAAQFARMAGARVIATSSSAEKAERLKALGVDEVINYSEDPKWGRTARELSDGGVDHLVEVAGGDLSQSLQALRVGGSLCLVGALTRQPITFPAAHMIYGNLHVSGITVGSRQQQVDMVKAVEAGGLRPVIDSIHSFDDLRGAFEVLEAQKHFGKIAIAYG